MSSIVIGEKITYSSERSWRYLFKGDDSVSSQNSEGMVGHGCVSSELFDGGLIGGCDGSIVQ